MKTLAAILAAICIGLATLAPAEAGHGGPHPADHAAHRPRPIYAVPTAFTVNDAIAAIAAASARWGVAEGWLLRVARCESGLNPYAYNPYSGNSGLYQFLPGTYWLYAARIGETRSYWNPYGSANVAAFMFYSGLAYEWGCR